MSACRLILGDAILDGDSEDGGVVRLKLLYTFENLHITVLLPLQEFSLATPLHSFNINQFL